MRSYTHLGESGGEGVGENDDPTEDFFGEGDAFLGGFEAASLLCDCCCCCLPSSMNEDDSAAKDVDSSIESSSS